MMKLFGHSGACSQTIHILLYELEESFSFERVDLRTRQLADGSDYRAVSERGQVPALLLADGTLLTELAAIVQYLADRHPDRGLLPPVGSVERYQALGWLSYVGSELHKGISPMMRPDTPEEYRAVARAAVGAKLGWLNDQIGTRAFLSADRFTPADAYLFVVLGWLGMIGIDGSAYPNLMAFRAAVASRPSVRAALVAEGF
jgi:glutathione S-transferase